MRSEDHGELTIGTLAKSTGCRPETVRYYERVGVLPEPARSRGGQRRYRREHVKRLRFVRRARELGFPLDEVRGLLWLVDEPGHTCAEVEEVTRGHLDAVRSRLADLRALERVLDRIVAQCKGGTVPECPVIDALSGDALARDALGGGAGAGGREV